MDHALNTGWQDFANTANVAFLLGFPSLFSIINPIGGALIFDGVTKDFAHVDRIKVARLIGVYSLLIMFGALWTGAYVLNFFGVSIDALRIAGGAVVVLSGWQLLMSARSSGGAEGSRTARSLRRIRWRSDAARVFSADASLHHRPRHDRRRHHPGRGASRRAASATSPSFSA